MSAKSYTSCFIAISRSASELNRRLQELEELKPRIEFLTSKCQELLTILESNINTLYNITNESENQLSDDKQC